MFMIDNFMQTLMARIVCNIDDIEAACLLHFYLQFHSSYRREITPSAEHPRTPLTDIMLRIRTSVRDHEAVYALRNLLLKSSTESTPFAPPLQITMNSDGSVASGNSTQCQTVNFRESPSPSNVVRRHPQGLGSFPSHLLSDEGNVQINPQQSRSFTAADATISDLQHGLQNLQLEPAIQRPAFCDAQYMPMFPFLDDEPNKPPTKDRPVDQALVNELAYHEAYRNASSAFERLSLEPQTSSSTTMSPVGSDSFDENENTDEGSMSDDDAEAPHMHTSSNAMAQPQAIPLSGATNSHSNTRYLKCMWDNGSCGQKIKLNDGNIEFMDHFTIVHGANYAILTKKGTLSEKDTSKGYDFLFVLSPPADKCDTYGVI
ncbi:hypothetical protein BDN70DRAFT_900456 [Pholiota conissans]|uniref:Uncharacterized protein n=1 Tax=Pholiota conissans TaxID=109636 RepID=A0A9P5YNS3_9AGAR|nr:hypothetical protein BDN70DRAFT_900456 [Pholiota conissans]